MAVAMIAGQYDWKLVALSIVIAFCACYITLELAERAAGSPPNRKNFWLGGAALSTGVGFWGLHDLGLLAFRQSPSLSTSLALAPIFLSVAFACAFLPLWPFAQKHSLDTKRYQVAVAISSCVGAIFYSALENAKRQTQPGHPFELLASSVAISLAACGGTFQLQDYLRNKTVLRKLTCSALIAITVAGIQYLRIATSSSSLRMVTDGYEVASLIVIWSALLLLVIVGLSILGSKFDEVLNSQRRRLQSDADRWRLVLSANQEGLFDFDLVSGETFYSPRWKEILGYGPDELENALDTWQQRIHPEDKLKVDAVVEHYLQSKKGNSEVEYRLQHRETGWRWVRTRMQAEWNALGESIRLVGSTCDITEGRQAVAECSASELRFQAFMQHNPEIAFIRDQEGKFLYGNPSLEKAWEIAPGAWSGKSAAEIWPGEAAGIVESDRDVLGGDVHCEMIEEHQLPDKTLRQFITSKFSFPDVSGKRLVGGISVDITERIRKEAQLRASEAKYRELFEKNPLPSWIQRADDGRIVDVNQAAVEHYGWSRNQFLSLTAASLMSSEPQDADWIARVRHRRNEKSDIWVELSTNDLDTADGKQHVVMAQDVTDRVALEEAARQQRGLLEILAERRAGELQQSELKWQKLVEALPQIIWLARADGFCEYISESLSSFTGSPNARLLGWGYVAFVHPADRENLKTNWTKAVASGSEYAVEYRIRNSDGDYRWFMTRGRPVPGSENKPQISWLGITSDIEEQKRFKDEAQIAIAESTVALREASEQAQRGEESKRQFLISISEEVAPAADGIIGATDSILDTTLTGKQRSCVESIRQHGNALVHISKDVLDLVKIEAGGLELENVEFDLEDLLEEVVETVSAAAIQRGIRLVLDLEQSMPPKVVGDSRRLSQILLNMGLSSVREASPGVMVLKVRAEGESEEDQPLTLNFRILCSSVLSHPSLSNAQPGEVAPVQPEELAEPYGQPGLLQLMAQTSGRVNLPTSSNRFGLIMAEQLAIRMSGSVGVITDQGKAQTFWCRINLKVGSKPTTTETDTTSVRTVMVLMKEPHEALLNHLKRMRLKVLAPEHAGDDLAQSIATVSIVIADSVSLKETYPLLENARRPILVLASEADCAALGLAFAPDMLIGYLAEPVRRLPLVNAVEQIFKQAADRDEAAKAQSRLELQDSEILLVEDTQVSQLITKLFLSQMGCHVTVAANGKEACLAFDKLTFDLILMDCQMPIMDGFQATRMIREKEMGMRRRTPIIALSAGVLKEERERCYAAGMDDFLSKPLEKFELEAALRKWLANEKKADTSQMGQIRDIPKAVKQAG